MSSSDSDEKLIQEVQQRPELYKKNHPGDLKSKAKSKEWEKIAILLKSDPETLKKKWKSFTAKFKREYDKTQRRSGDGAESIDNSDWNLYTSLLFLKDTVVPEKTESNLKDLFDDQAVDEDDEDDDGHDDTELWRFSIISICGNPIPEFVKMFQRRPLLPKEEQLITAKTMTTMWGKLEFR
ncbi:hypothetical protein TKK_0001685 [Trichogramma kaykai]